VPAACHRRLWLRVQRQLALASFGQESRLSKEKAKALE